METSKTTDIAVIKQEVKFREWAAQIEAHCQANRGINAFQFQLKWLKLLLSL